MHIIGTGIHTWRQGAPDAAGYRVAQSALRPLRQDVQQHSGHPVQTLTAGEVLAPRAGNCGDDEGLLLGLPEAQHPPQPVESTYLKVEVTWVAGDAHR